MTVGKTKVKSREKTKRPLPLMFQKAFKSSEGNDAPTQARKDGFDALHTFHSSSTQASQGHVPPSPSSAVKSPSNKVWDNLEVGVTSYPDSDDFHVEVINPRHGSRFALIAEVFFRDGGYEVIEADNSPIGSKGYPSREQFDRAITVAKEELKPYVSMNLRKEENRKIEVPVINK
jgi:hypothetical protein